MATPYQVKDEQLTQGERNHLNTNLFPLLCELKAKARARRIAEQCRRVRESCDETIKAMQEGKKDV
jgi:hypothetical protein